MEENARWRKKLLDEENILISDFAGSTVTLNGDARKYAESALSNIRESHRYGASSIDNGYRAIESSRTCSENLDNTYCSQSEQYSKAADLDSSKSQVYANDANDDIKKLEALQ